MSAAGAAIAPKPKAKAMSSFRDANFMPAERQC
jgi:hypothetical protein